MRKKPEGLVVNKSFTTENSQALQAFFLPPSSSENTVQSFSTEAVFSARAICTEAVNSAKKNKVTLLQAPAGYGKTELLKFVYANSPVQRIWINLDQDDNDPRRLVEKLVAGLNFCGIPISAYEQETMQEINAEQLATVIARSLPTDQRVLVFFLGLDSIHEPFGLKLVEALVRSAPNKVHFQLAMASPVAIDLSALAMRNQVRYFLQEVLAFKPEEACRLIDAAVGESGAAEKQFDLVQKLVTDTDGWAVAISSALESLARGEELSQVVDSLLEGRKEIDRYLEFTALKELPKNNFKLLYTLSLLDRFTVQQAVYVLDSAESESLSQVFERFPFLFDEYEQGQTWYRFHRPLRTYLRKLCSQKIPADGITELKIRAAHWYFDHGWIEAAIDLILNCERYDLGAQWLLRYAEIAKQKGNHSQLLIWLQQLPAEELSKHPSLQAAYVLCLMLTKRFIQSDSTTTGLAGLISDNVMDQQQIARNVPLLSMATLALKDEIEGLGDGIDLWLSTWEGNSDYKSAPDYNLEMGLAKQIKGFYCKCESNFKEGDLAFNQSRKHFEAYSSDYGIAWTETLHTVLLAKQGLYFEAQIKARDGLEFIRRHLHSGIDIQHMLSALLSAMYFECGEWDKAKEFFPEDFDNVVSFGFADILIAAYETQSKILLWEGETDTVVDQIKSNIKQAESNGIPRVVYALVNQLIILLIRLRRIDEARQYADRYLDLGEADNTSPKLGKSLQQSLTRASRIHFYIEDQEYQLAESAVTSAIETLKQQKRYYSLVEAYCLSALIHYQMDERGMAKDMLGEALSIAALRNYVMVFDQHHSIMWEILSDFKKAELEPRVRKFYTRLKQTVFASLGKEKDAHDALTKKEKKVIQAAESGDSTLELAQQFNISQGTLKWHLHNIYGKLGASNRTQAIKKAKELGYIED